LWNLRARTLKLTLDSVTEQDEATLVIVANGRYIGEGLALAPNADLEDGLFDVVTVGALSRWELLRFAWRLLQGRHLSLPQVQRAQAGTVEIQRIHRSHRPLPVHADDHISAYTPVRMDCLPGALRVLAPASPSGT
jgi:diacylglycerol kinase family enzyme